MLDSHLDRQVEMSAGRGCVKLYLRGQSYGKRLLVRVLPEDEALPVYPCIYMQGTYVVEELETCFRVCCQVQLRIIKRRNQVVIAPAV